MDNISLTVLYTSEVSVITDVYFSVSFRHQVSYSIIFYISERCIHVILIWQTKEFTTWDRDRKYDWLLGLG